MPFLKGNKLGLGRKHNLGRKHSIESRINMSLSKIGRPCYEETKEKLSKMFKGRKNPWTAKMNWKGDDVGYRGLHRWIIKMKGRPDKCSHCLRPRTTPSSIHWANISKLYKRDVDDFVALCVKCHKAYDGGKLILKN